MFRFWSFVHVPFAGTHEFEASMQQQPIYITSDILWIVQQICCIRIAYVLIVSYNAEHKIWQIGS